MARALGGASFEDAIARLLGQAELTTDRVQRLDLLRRAAQIYEVQVGDADKAFAVWQAAFALDFCDTRSAEAIERFAQRLGRGSALVSELWPLVGGITDGRQRASLLGWLGRWLALFTDERSRAEECLVESLKLDPSCAVAAATLRLLAQDVSIAQTTPPPVTVTPPAPVARDEQELQRKLDSAVALGRWKDAVEILRLLAGGAELLERARYLATAGKILHRKLHQEDAAIRLFNESLDADPANMPVFDRVSEMLAARSNWRELESSILKMIDRLKTPRTSPEAQTLEALWRRLGDLYRDRLNNPAAAQNAYQTAARLRPPRR
jgi:tetratricopeptide (TPR) repeat protein